MCNNLCNAASCPLDTRSYPCWEDAGAATQASVTLPSEEVSGSLTKLTHAAEALASHAASQAAGLFSYRTEEEKKAEENPGAEEHAKQAEEVEATQESRHSAAVAPLFEHQLEHWFV